MYGERDQKAEDNHELHAYIRTHSTKCPSHLLQRVRESEMVLNFIAERQCGQVVTEGQHYHFDSCTRAESIRLHLCSSVQRLKDVSGRRELRKGEVRPVSPASNSRTEVER